MQLAGHVLQFAPARPAHVAMNFRLNTGDVEEDDRVLQFVLSCATTTEVQG